jgi:hypothetical protein
VRQFSPRLFRSLAQHGAPLRYDKFRWELWVIGTRHAGIQMNFDVASQYTSADQFASLFQSAIRRFASPWKWPQMVAAKQYSIACDPYPSRCRMDGVGKLARRLACITTQLVHLA